MASGDGLMTYGDRGPEVQELVQLLKAAGLAQQLQGDKQEYDWRLLDEVRKLKARAGRTGNDRPSGIIDQDFLRMLLQAIDQGGQPASVDPAQLSALRALLGSRADRTAPHIDAPAPAGSLPARSLLNPGFTGRPGVGAPVSSGIGRQTLEQILDDVAAGRPPPSVARPAAPVARPAAPVARPAAPVAATPTSSATHWPVPGHFSLNKADKRGEGEGGFGTRRVLHTERGDAFRPHEGVDIQAPLHTPVEAFKSGRVAFAGNMEGFGNTVVLQHEDKTQTLYGHLGPKLKVRFADQVGAGTQLGTVGRSGNVPPEGDAHLHFGLYQGATSLTTGAAVDPWPALRASREAALKPPILSSKPPVLNPDGRPYANSDVVRGLEERFGLHAEGNARGHLGAPSHGMPILEMGPTMRPNKVPFEANAKRFLDAVDGRLGGKGVVLLAGHRDTPQGHKSSGAGGTSLQDPTRTLEQELNDTQCREIVRQAKARGMNVTYQESLGRPQEGDDPKSNWTVAAKLAAEGRQPIEIHFDRDDLDSSGRHRGHGGLIR